MIWIIGFAMLAAASLGLASTASEPLIRGLFVTLGVVSFCAFLDIMVVERLGGGL